MITIQRGEQPGIIKAIKAVLLIVTFVSVLAELIIFPSVANLVGCMMVVIVHIIFVQIDLNEYYITRYPFSFILMLSMFMYRYLPLAGTLISGREISYGMNTPIRTFIYETLFFILFNIVFCIACRGVDEFRILKRLHNTFNLYEESTDLSIWIVGLVGVAVRLYTYSSGGAATTGVMHTLIDFMYAPVLLFFPSLYKTDTDRSVCFSKVSVWAYIVIICIINLPSNSRADIIAPFIILVILWLLCLVKDETDISSIVEPKKIIAVIVAAVIAMNVIQPISDAMLTVRSYRNDISISELLSETVYYAFGDGKNLISSDSGDSTSGNSTYSKGWTEDYIDNFALNRFANIRITDETLYLTDKMDASDMKKMQKDLWMRIVSLIPQPVLNMLGFNINKSDYNSSSRGDVLYYYSGAGNSYSLGGYRVTSLLADGLATFGVFSIVIQIVALYILMRLLNSLAYADVDGKVYYSAFGLVSAYNFLTILTNSNGLYSILSECLRGYWFGIIFWLIVKWFANLVANSILFRKQ